MNFVIRTKLKGDINAKKITIMVAFSARNLTSVDIRAKVLNVKGSCFGDIASTTINFSGCESVGEGKCTPIDSYDKKYIEIEPHISSISVSNIPTQNVDRIEKFIYKA